MARTTTTALLRSQASRLRSQQNYEDSIADYEWNMSAKTADDYDAYIAHYQNRMESGAYQPNEVLTFQKRIDSANRSFISNEIQRATIDVLEGNASEEQKLDKLGSLYAQAQVSGDYSLAQDLRQQIDSQIIKIQTAYQTAASSGGGYGGGSGSSQQDTLIKQDVTDLIDSFKKGTLPLAQAEVNGEQRILTMNDISALIATFGEQGLDTTLQADAQKGVEMVYGLLEQTVGKLEAMAAQIGDDGIEADVLNKINELRTTKLDIGGSAEGSGTISMNELRDELNRRAVGNGKYTFALDGDGNFALKKLSVQDKLTSGSDITLDSAGNPVFGAQYAPSEPLEVKLGYAPGEEIVYEFKDGALRPMFRSELPKNVKSLTSASNGVLTGGALLTQAQILEKAGIFDNGDGTYRLSEGAQNIIKNSGVNLGSTGLINKDAVTFDPETGMPELITPDMKNAVTWQTQGESIVPVVKIATTQNQYLKNQGYEQGPTTTDVLGSQMYTDLQTNVRGSVLQKANNTKLVQGAAGGTVLQRAANAQQIMQMNAAEIERLKVEAIKQAQQVAVTNVVAPKVTGVQNNQQVVKGFQVQDLKTPTLSGVSNAPSNKMTSGGAKVQGTAKVQLAGNINQLTGQTGLSVTNGSVKPIGLTVR